MSYFRGPLYIWNDGTHVHLWNADGYDSWDESGWVESFRGQTVDTASLGPAPSGVQIAQQEMDAYVVMRFAELVQAGTVTQVIAHALTQVGNVGAEALQAKGQILAAAFPPIAAGATVSAAT